MPKDVSLFDMVIFCERNIETRCLSSGLILIPILILNELYAFVCETDYTYIHIIGRPTK